MLVSTKGRYALRVMIDLAQHQAAGRTPLKKIAARQGISEKYLENILAILVRNGMLSGMRGKGGGYCLTRPADQYTVGEILRLTEGSLAPVSCLVEGAAACGLPAVGVLWGYGSRRELTDAGAAAIAAATDELEEILIHGEL